MLGLEADDQDASGLYGRQQAHYWSQQELVIARSIWMCREILQVKERNPQVAQDLDSFWCTHLSLSGSFCYIQFA